jgi:ribosomal-protein-alanine N-acetyltransferase
MTSADLSAVLRLEQELFGEEAWSRAMLRGELAQQPASRHYLVADDDGAITGYAGLLAAGSQGDVLTLAVAAGRWGQGTGSALLEALLTEAARRGCTEIFLEVRADNARAQQLYRRYGFVQIGIRRGYYQPSGTDALVMRKALGPDPAGTARPAGAQAAPAGLAGDQAAPAGLAGVQSAPADTRAGQARTKARPAGLPGKSAASLPREGGRE